MKKNRSILGILGIIAALALSLVSCQNSSDAPIIVTVPATTTTGGESTTTTGGGGTTTTTTGGENTTTTSGTEAPDFWTDWENMEFLSINDKGTLDTKVASPWNRNASLTLMSEALCKDRRKRDGWEMAFSLMNQEGYPDTNYFGLYNKYLGTLRVYYYCNVAVAGSGSDFAYEILFETDTGDCKAFYNSLRYGIPLNAQVNKSADLLGGGVAQTFHLLCTPYSEIGMTTLRKGWHAFDIDLSSYSEGRHFILDGTRMKIVCKSVSNSSGAMRSPKSIS